MSFGDASLVSEGFVLLFVDVAVGDAVLPADVDGAVVLEVESVAETAINLHLFGLPHIKPYGHIVVQVDLVLQRVLFEDSEKTVPFEVNYLCEGAAFALS